MRIHLTAECAQEALNVLPNTATVKDTAALDEFQVRAAPIVGGGPLRRSLHSTTFAR